MSHWYLGTIGYSYKDWVGEFYPKGTSQHEYLPFYSKVFNSVELDTTFHSIPQLSTVQAWSNNTPNDFVFCVKTPRIITHELKLKGVEGLMEEFLASLTPIQAKLGPILIQLPPMFSQANYQQLSEFLKNLPGTYRYAVEFRHPSWYKETTKQLLAQYRIAWVTIDYPKLPKAVQNTTDFLYIRWIGINNQYHYHTHERVDKTQQLMSWIDEIASYLDEVSAIYGYFNNDYAGFAAGTGRRFMRLIGLSSIEPELPSQGKLF